MSHHCWDKWAERKREVDNIRLIIIPQFKLEKEDKWNVYLRAPEVFHKIIKNTIDKISFNPIPTHCDIFGKRLIWLNNSLNRWLQTSFTRCRETN